MLRAQHTGGKQNTHENDPQYESRLNQLPEAQKLALKYGLWKCLDHLFQLIKNTWLQKALSGDVESSGSSFAIGADYAESRDKCTAVISQGGRVLEVKEWPGMPTNEYARILYEEVIKCGKNQTFMGVDSIGPGSGVYHALVKLGIGNRVALPV